MEAMLWARGEYRYADIGTWSPTDARLSPGVGSTFAVTDAIRIRTQTATAGVGYKF
jgi:opacity protein-like surface antigen